MDRLPRTPCFRIRGLRPRSTSRQAFSRATTPAPFDMASLDAAFLTDPKLKMG
jgi:hypothetical protein